MNPDDTAIHRRVVALRDGNDPACVTRLRSGWVVLGDPQVIPGYCLLFPDPVVPQLNTLDRTQRGEFLADMAHVGDVLLGALGATRINYAIYGNVEPALHAHIFPRRSDEVAPLVTAQPWAFDWSAAPRFSSVLHSALLVTLVKAFAHA